MVAGRAVIIEFVGPPGAGKTTSCHCFTELLRRKSFHVLTRQDIHAYLKRMNLLSKSLLLAGIILFRFHRLCYFIFTLALNGIFSADSLYRYLRLTVYQQVLHQLLDFKKADIVILDQWLIQELWSATIFKKKSYSRITHHLQPFYFRTDVVIFFKIDVATAARRIEFRSSGFSRFDLMDKSSRLEELERHSGYLFDLYQKSPCKHKYIYSANHLPAKNAELFMHHLEQLYATLPKKAYCGRNS